jgi:nucleoside-diphosphate-sugar epimerase
VPRLVVTGANGFVGRHVVAAARAAGWDALGLVRTEEGVLQVEAAGGRGFQVPGLDGAALLSAFAGAQAVVHLAQIGTERGAATYESVNVAGTQAVAEAAARAGVPRIAFLSGLGVAHYGQRRRTTNPYFLSKLQAEVALYRSGLEVAVFRPSYLVGPGDGLVRGLLADMAAAEVERPGDGTYRMQPLAITDAAAAILTAVQLGWGSPRHRVWDCVGPQPVTYREFLAVLTRAAAAQGRPTAFRVREVPIEEADRQAAAGGYRGMLPDELDCLLCDEVADPRPLEDLLGRPLLPLHDAVAAAVRGTPGVGPTPGASR